MIIQLEQMPSWHYSFIVGVEWIVWMPFVFMCPWVRIKIDAQSVSPCGFWFVSYIFILFMINRVLFTILFLLRFCLDGLYFLILWDACLCVDLSGQPVLVPLTVGHSCYWRGCINALLPIGIKGPCTEKKPVSLALKMWLADCWKSRALESSIPSSYCEP